MMKVGKVLHELGHFMTFNFSNTHYFLPARSAENSCQERLEWSNFGTGPKFLFQKHKFSEQVCKKFQIFGTAFGTLFFRNGSFFHKIFSE